MRYQVLNIISNLIMKTKFSIFERHLARRIYIMKPKYSICDQHTNLATKGTICCDGIVVIQCIGVLDCLKQIHGTDLELCIFI